MKSPRILALSITSLLLAPALHAQTLFNFTGAKSNLWSDPTTVGMAITQPNWSPLTVPPAPPDAADEAASIPSGLSVNVNGNFVVGQLTLGANAGVTIDGTQLQIQAGAFAGSGTIDNAGTIGVSNNGTFALRSDATLTGGGTITMSGSAATGYGLIGSGFAGYAGRLTNVNNTIQGAGLLGQTFNGPGRIAFTNQGLVDANVPFVMADGNAFNLIFDTLNAPDANGNFGINSGTLRASNGGRLILNGSVTNTGGVIQAQNNSVVHLSALNVIGGTLTTAGTGVVRVTDSVAMLRGVTNAGLLDAPNQSIQLFGTTVNTGTITLSAAGGTSILFAGTGGATLTGGGTVTLAGVADNRVGGLGLTNQDNTIQGAGSVGGDGFINQGLVLANTPGAILSAQANARNSGTFRASNGGILQLATFPGDTFDNTGGIIEALTGSTARIVGNGVVITGGTLRTVGTGVIEGAGNNTLQGLANEGSYVQKTNSGVTLLGTINNAGSILLEGSAGFGITSAGATLTGNGTVTLSGGGSGGAGTFTNQGNTIRGVGVIQANGLTIINRVLVDANVPFVAANNNNLLLGPGTAGVNSGTLQASNGGRLYLLFGAIDNAGGTIQALAGSQVYFDRLGITGGTIAGSGTGIAQLNEATVAGLTLAGHVQVVGFASRFAGTIQNTGTVVVGPGSGSGIDIIAAGTTTLAGAGTLTLSNGSRLAVSGGRTFNNESTIRGGGGIFGNDFGSGAIFDFTNSGLIEATDAARVFDLYNMNFVNAAAGIVRATSTLGLQLSSGTFTNNGLFEAINGATLSLFNSANLTNYNAATETLTGGTFRVTSPGATTTLDLQNRPIVTSAADITLSGANSVFAAIDGLTRNDGSFEIRDGRNFTTVGAFTNNGSITVGNASTLTFTDDVTGSGSLNIGAGGTVILAASAPGPQPVPEPGTCGLIVGVVVLWSAVRRRM